MSTIHINHAAPKIAHHNRQLEPATLKPTISTGDPSCPQMWRHVAISLTRCCLELMKLGQCRGWAGWADERVNAK